MANNKEQEWLFDQDFQWKEQWQGMPEFVQEDQTPYKSIVVHFETLEDMQAFAQRVEQTVTVETRSIWYPKAEIERYANKRYKDES